MIMLSSLRVAADFDASGYARGAAQKTAADQVMIASDRARGASLAAADALMDKSIPGLARLSKSYVTGYGEAAKFEAEVRALGRAMDRGGGAERAALIYENMARKFKLTANAADLARAGYIGLAPVISDVNARLQTQAATAGTASKSLQAQAIQMARTTVGAKLSRAEMQNLSYQFSDMAVMLASGQAPFLMLMQQGMQVSDALGPRGLRGAIQAVGTGLAAFVTNPINLAVVGFASLAGVAASFFSSTSAGAPKLEEKMTRISELAKQLAESYGMAADNFGKIGARPAQVIEVMLRFDVEQARQTLKKDLAGILDDLSVYTIESEDYGKITRDPGVNPYAPFIDQIKQMQRELAAGTADADRYAKTLSEMIKLNPTLAASGAPLVAQLEKIAAGMAAVETRAKAVNTSLRQFDAASLDALKSWQSDARGNVNRLRREFELDLREQNAKSPADRGAIAAERERLRLLTEQVEPLEAAARIDFARRLAISAATKEIADQNRAIGEQIALQNRNRLRTANDNLEQARLEVAIAGLSPREQAEQRANLQTLLDLQHQAEDNNIALNVVQLAQLRAINAEWARQGELLREAQLGRDIGFERRALFMPKDESDITRRLNAAGIKEGTAAFEDFAKQLRDINRLERTFGYGIHKGFQTILEDTANFADSAESLISDMGNGMKNAWVEFARTGKISMDSLTETVIGDLAEIAYKFATNELFNMLINGGSSGGIGGGIGGGLSGILNLFFGGSTGLYAKGAVFGNGVRMFGTGAAFANRVLTQPTMFAYGADKLGIAGEAGPEAVMPLTRGRNGRLGVAASGGGASMINVAMNSTINLSGSYGGTEQRLKRALDERDKAFAKRLPAMMRDARQRGKAN